jgi:hypothetical protein
MLKAAFEAKSANNAISGHPVQHIFFRDDINALK